MVNDMKALATFGSMILSMIWVGLPVFCWVIVYAGTPENRVVAQFFAIVTSVLAFVCLWSLLNSYYIKGKK